MRNLSKVIIAVKNKNLQVNMSGDPSICGEGKYRVISKDKNGFIVNSIKYARSAMEVFHGCRIKSIYSVARIKEIVGGGEQDFTVYARSGNKVWIEEDMLEEVLNDINRDLYRIARVTTFEDEQSF